MMSDYANNKNDINKRIKRENKNVDDKHKHVIFVLVGVTDLLV
jgi:hypothetical protein